MHWIYLPSAIGDEESIVLMAPQPYKIDGADHTLVARSNGKAEWLPQSFAISEIQRKAIAAKAVQ